MGKDNDRFHFYLHAPCPIVQVIRYPSHAQIPIRTVIRMQPMLENQRREIPIRKTSSPILVIVRVHLTPGLFPCLPYASCFGAVIGDGLFEPSVFEGLFGGDALFGIVLEDVVEKVDELLVEGASCRDHLLGIVSCVQIFKRTTLTFKCFMALTYFLEDLFVSALG